MKTILLVASTLFLFPFAANVASAEIPPPAPCFALGGGTGPWAFVWVGSNYGGVIVHTSYVDVTGPTNCRVACGSGSTCIDCRLLTGNCVAS